MRMAAAAAPRPPPPRGSSRRGPALALAFLWPLLMAAVLAGLRPVGATVTVLGTGSRYASRQDRSVGRQLWRGYEYMAALQAVPGNLPLCPPPPDSNSNSTDGGYYANVTVPDDGLPVALLVRSGAGCTLEQKVEFALARLRPSGLVRYLIVDDGPGVRVRGGNENNVNDRNENISDGGAEMMVRKEPAGKTAFAPGRDRVRRRGAGAAAGFASSDAAVAAVGDGGDGEIPLYIVYVSAQAQLELLDYLLRLDPETAKSGGPRISIDARGAADGWWGGEGGVYVALSALLSACACSFVLFAGGNYCCFSLWGADDDFGRGAGQHQHPPRPQRRRLTREQVKRAIPQWFFDGDDEPLRPVRRVSVAAAAAAGGEDGGNASLGGGVAGLADGGAADEPLLPVPPPRPVELSLCSICLDDYEPGDKLRVLQCNHAFHGKCIGKWLVERSATCPLCKTEIWADHDEEEEEGEGGAEGRREDNHGAGTAPAAPVPPPPREYGANGWDRAWHRFFAADAYQYLQQQPQQQQPVPVAPGAQEHSLQPAAIADPPGPRGTNLRRLLSRLRQGPLSAEANGRAGLGRGGSSASGTLSEPLLPLHANESELQTLAPRSRSPSPPRPQPARPLAPAAAAGGSSTSRRSGAQGRRPSSGRPRAARRRIRDGGGSGAQAPASAPPPASAARSDPLAPPPADEASAGQAGRAAPGPDGAAATAATEEAEAASATTVPPGHRQVSV